LGDVYAQVLLGVFQPHWRVEQSAVPALCFILRDDPETLKIPLLQAAHIQRYVESHYRALERMLDLGPFQHLLPTELRRQTVVEKFDVPAFLERVSRMVFVPTPETAHASLSALI